MRPKHAKPKNKSAALKEIDFRDQLKGLSKSNGIKDRSKKDHDHESADHRSEKKEHEKTRTGKILTDAELLKILTKVKKGNFSVRLPSDQHGTKGAICEAINE